LANTGLAWQIESESIPVQGRYGQGVIACKLKGEEEIVGCLFGKPNQQGLVHFQKSAAKTVRVDVIPVSKRNVRGKPAFTLKDGESVYQITRILDDIEFWEKRVSSD
jgi:hypothetical protein